MASKTSNLDLRTSKLASPTDEDTAIFEGAAVIAAGILNNETNYFFVALYVLQYAQ